MVVRRLDQEVGSVSTNHFSHQLVWRRTREDAREAREQPVPFKRRSRRERADPSPAPFDPRALEHQQAMVLSMLRRAAGAPVSYAQLRDGGVELPASVISELELAGLAIERCYGGTADERKVVGVRLDPALDPDRAPAAPAADDLTGSDVVREAG